VSFDSVALPEKLARGFARFQKDRFARNEQRYRAIATAEQRPASFVISCCDSRVSPEVIFDTEPGDIFVMRNIANIVPPFELSGQYHGTSAALDFAVRRLEVASIVVLGHSGCGGVAALAEAPCGAPKGEFLGPWLQLIDKGMQRRRRQLHSCASDLRAMEFQCVKNSLTNLMTFPWISERCRCGALDIIGAHFSVGEGQLRVFDPQNERWALSRAVDG
jgi:carbonic anhydrase